MWILYFLCGACGGVLGGMGMGGGTLLIPLLTMICGVKQHTAQAINLVAFVPMSAVALCIHFKNGLVDKKSAVKPIVFATATVICGSLLARRLSAKMLSRFFGGFLVLLSLFQLFVKQKNDKSEKPPVLLTPPSAPLGSVVDKNNVLTEVNLPKSMQKEGCVKKHNKQ